MRAFAVLLAGAWLRCLVGAVFDPLANDGIQLNTAVLEEGFCTSPASPDEAWASAGEINTATMDCAKLMEFIYIARLKAWERLEQLKKESGPKDGATIPWKTALRSASTGTSLLGAHAHVLAAIASQRPECFSEHVRLLLIVNLRRTKTLETGHFKLLWLMGQDGNDKEEELTKQLREWLTEACSLLEADLRTLRTVLRTWRLPAIDEARFYSHEADGRFSTMESLRRDTFTEWQLDKGLLQGMIRHIFPLDAVVGDFGAGSGHYASWLNDTGLVEAYAYDGSPDIELVTKSKVLSADLGKPLKLFKKFDWVLCLEVAEHIPPEFTETFMRNIDDHTKEGAILSWARPGLQGLGSANPQSEADVVELVRRYTGLHVDQGLTRQLRSASQVTYLAESLLVLVRHPRAGGGGDVGAATTSVGGGCQAEEGWIYAGNDVQMFSNIESAAACCELCNSNDLCRFWTWSREDSHKELCWIKATREYRVNHEGFISGARSE